MTDLRNLRDQAIALHASNGNVVQFVFGRVSCRPGDDDKYMAQTIDEVNDVSVRIFEKTAEAAEQRLYEAVIRTITNQNDPDYVRIYHVMKYIRTQGLDYQITCPKVDDHSEAGLLLSNGLFYRARGKKIWRAITNVFGAYYITEQAKLLDISVTQEGDQWIATARDNGKFIASASGESDEKARKMVKKAGKTHIQDAFNAEMNKLVKPSGALSIDRSQLTQLAEMLKALEN